MSSWWQNVVFINNVCKRRSALQGHIRVGVGWVFPPRRQLGAPLDAPEHSEKEEDESGTVMIWEILQKPLDLGHWRPRSLHTRSQNYGRLWS